MPARCLVALASILAAGVGAVGCAGHRPPAVPGAAPAAEPVVAATAPEPVLAADDPLIGQPLTGEAPTDESMFAQASASAPPAIARPRLHDLCRRANQGRLVDDARRFLEETFCSATLWFDGMFGGEPDIANALAVSGRIELSDLYTQAEGNEPKARLRLRYDLPNLERRVNLFLGRDDREEFIADRREGLAIRSSIFGLDTEDNWLAGLGYAPPGRWASRLDFRVGGKLKTAPEIFAQGRYRHNVFMGERAVWRLRETAFWENREDGFGFTSSADYDRMVRRNLVFRWNSVGSITEATEGVAWREAIVFYYNIKRAQAVAAELFARGSTDAEVRIREFGPRFIYRRPLGNPFLFGEFVVGYTWPRFEREEPREGSGMVGFGLELLFGRDPF